jgi:hypothetical protein
MYVAWHIIWHLLYLHIYWTGGHLCTFNLWYRNFTYNSNKSPTWCNSFSVYYPDVCLQLNMFRAFFCPSSEARGLQWQSLVLPSYCGDSRAVFVVGPARWFGRIKCKTPVPNVKVHFNFALACKFTFPKSSFPFKFYKDCVTVLWMFPDSMSSICPTHLTILDFITLIISYLLTPWSRVLLEKLTVNFAASKEIPRIYGTRKFLTVTTSARHLVET